MAQTLDVELQDYLKAYFAMRGQSETQLTGNEYIEARNAEIEEFSKEDNLEFSGSETVSDDDIPFGLIMSIASTGLMAAIYLQQFIAFTA